jgi:pimeloyl-ACP methyl ester carboxylesterase
LIYRAGTIKSKIEKDYAVVYFDQRGSGMSQGRYSEDGISIDIMAEDVLALVKVIKHKYGDDSRFFLMGHSWGGTLGTAVLLKDQDVFNGWIEVGGAHDPKGLYSEYIVNHKNVATEQINAKNNVAYWEGVIDLIDKVDIVYNEDDSYEMNKKAHNAEEKLTDDKVINEIDEDIASQLSATSLFKNNLLTTWWNGANTGWILADQGLWQDLSYTNRLNEITLPALLLWGKYDLVVPPKFGQDALDNLGSSAKELVVFEKSGHSPMFLEPEKFADEVIGFINQHK